MVFLKHMMKSKKRMEKQNKTYGIQKTAPEH